MPGVRAVFLRTLMAVGLGWCAMSAAGAFAQPPVFRVGVAPGTAAACAAQTGVAGADALSAHLSARLKRPVEICSYATTDEAGAAISTGAADLVSLDPAGMMAAGPGARSLLAPREKGSIGRILSVAVVKEQSPASSLAALKSLRFVYGGSATPHLAGPKAALLDNGLASDAAASETIEATPEAAFARLKAGEADVLVLHASAWQRVCRGATVQDKPCAGFKEIFRGRERPERAFAVRSDLDLETLHRLVGIMIALHIENKAAFDWLAPGAAELTPTEADALRIGSPAP